MAKVVVTRGHRGSARSCDRWLRQLDHPTTDCGSSEARITPRRLDRDICASRSRCFRRRAPAREQPFTPSPTIVRRRSCSCNSATLDSLCSGSSSAKYSSMPSSCATAAATCSASPRDHGDPSRRGRAECRRFELCVNRVQPDPEESIAFPFPTPHQTRRAARTILGRSRTVVDTPSAGLRSGSSHLSVSADRLRDQRSSVNEAQGPSFTRAGSRAPSTFTFRTISLRSSRASPAVHADHLLFGHGSKRIAWCPSSIR